MSTIKVGTLLAADGTTTTQPSIPALDKRMAKAWVDYDQNANSVEASYNISSVTDVSTGIFRLNFATNMSSNRYVCAGMADDNRDLSIERGGGTLPTVSDVTIECRYTTTLDDQPQNTVVIFGS